MMGNRDFSSNIFGYNGIFATGIFRVHQDRIGEKTLLSAASICAAPTMYIHISRE